MALFINSNFILLQSQLWISLTLQASIFRRLSACSADLRGFQSSGTASFFSAAITVSFPKSDYWRRSAVTPSCFPSSRFLRFWILLDCSLIFSSFLSRWRIFVLFYESFFLKHRAYLMSVQSSHEPELFAEASNHSCWRKTMQEKKKKT